MKLLHITLLSRDLAGAEAFYSTVLGLPVENRSADSISFRAGSTTLTFRFDNTADPFYHLAFNIPHNQLEEAIEWCRKRVELLPTEEGGIIADFQSWNAKSVYFYDPLGNILELIARYDLPNRSERPFSGASIENISEIGLVSDDVEALRETLIRQYRLPAFSRKTKQNAEFSVLGSDEGLLILSRTGRHWYPTDDAAAKFFTSVILETEGRTEEIILHP